MLKRKVSKLILAVRLSARLRAMKRTQPTQIVDFVFGQELIKPQQIRSELLRFAEIVDQQRPRGVMEIGTFRGGTLCILSRLAAADATIVSVDLPGGEFGGGYKWILSPLLRSFAMMQQKVHLIRGDSHSSSIFEKARSKAGAVDLLFIDGDHSYEGVRKDFETYQPLVRRGGGIIAFHDIAEHPPEVGCHVSELWNEVKSQYRHEEIIENRQQGWAGIGVLYL